MNRTTLKPIENANFGNAVADYVKHRAGFPDSLFRRLGDWGIGNDQQSILDVGTGTGSLARGFAQRGNRVIAIDIAPEMLEAASSIDAQLDLDIEYRLAPAEEIPLGDRSMDVVSAGQCWHWFNSSIVMQEALRVLKPGGWLIIAHFDWIPLRGNLVRLTEKLIEQHNPDWRGGNWNGLYGQWLRDMGEAGFQDVECFSYDEAVDYSPEAWRGRVRASAGIQGSLNQAQVTVFDKDLEKLLADRFPSPILGIPHRVFAARGRKVKG